MSLYAKSKKWGDSTVVPCRPGFLFTAIPITHKCERKCNRRLFSLFFINPACSVALYLLRWYLTLYENGVRSPGVTFQYPRSALAIKQYSERRVHALAQCKEKPHTPLSTWPTGVRKGMLPKWKCRLGPFHYKRAKCELSHTPLGSQDCWHAAQVVIDIKRRGKYFPNDIMIYEYTII